MTIASKSQGMLMIYYDCVVEVKRSYLLNTAVLTKLHDIWLNHHDCFSQSQDIWTITTVLYKSQDIWIMIYVSSKSRNLNHYDYFVNLTRHMNHYGCFVKVKTSYSVWLFHQSYKTSEFHEQDLFCFESQDICSILTI